jgi:hypothetical protein
VIPVVHHSKFGGQCLRWVDAVEKVGFPIGVMLLGDFDPAEVSRLLVLLCGGLDADATAACLSDLRQTMRAAGRVVAPVFGAPRS